MSINFRTATCLLTLFVLFAGGRISPGQQIPTKTDPVLVALDAKIGQFLEGVSAGQAQNAYQELLAGSQLARQEKAVKELIDKTNDLQKKYGPYREFERIAAKRVGSDLVLLKYLYKCENFPVVWYFTFYRTPTPGEAPPKSSTWRVVTLRFDTELELLGL